MRRQPSRCTQNGKIIYDFKFDAEFAAAERSKYVGIQLTVYRDPNCEHWHITKNTESY